MCVRSHRLSQSQDAAVIEPSTQPITPLHSRGSCWWEVEDKEVTSSGDVSIATPGPACMQTWAPLKHERQAKERDRETERETEREKKREKKREKERERERKRGRKI